MEISPPSETALCPGQLTPSPLRNTNVNLASCEPPNSSSRRDDKPFVGYRLYFKTGLTSTDDSPGSAPAWRRSDVEENLLSQASYQ
ncbi:hypothetical protein PFLUV_G00187910 [Perca fluviatilis]|uniref:Uncharacterized protein n=1 Tax=Perca fluviatilis TaxID=8168 RepID=A0A6A5EBH0_PERFL|nr:hypothetical protein PFLUV_G00187910 [Perca fluviatilis]